MLITEVILPGDKTTCAYGGRHLGLPLEYEYEDEDWPFPTVAELLRRQEGR